MQKIGIVGCGVIGKTLAHAIEDKFYKKARIAALCDIDILKADQLSQELKTRPRVSNLEGLIWRSHLVIEAASAVASSDIARRTVKQKRNILIMSVGGILEDNELFRMAEENNSRIYIPSGAIGGIDALKAAGADKINKIVLTTRKPVKGFEGVPFVVKNNIDLAKIEAETLLFEGPAHEAIKGFPQNVNVSAVLSLAGIGAEKTFVRIFTSPQYKRNVHEIEFEGSFGSFYAKVENLPMPGNPKTSYLAALSAIAMLEEILGKSAKIGT